MPWSRRPSARTSARARASSTTRTLTPRPPLGAGRGAPGGARAGSPAPGGRQIDRTGDPGVPTAAGHGLPAPAPWLVRRLFPLLATVVFIAIGMAVTIWWAPDIVGKTTWSLPADLW